MKNIVKEENRNGLLFVPFVAGRIYKADGIKVVCTKRTKCYAEFDVYNRHDVLDRHERLKINTFRNSIDEFVFSDLFMELHSTACVEYTEKLIDTLLMIKENLAYAEIISVAEGANVYFMHEYYYKFQRTKYSKPVYFVIDDTEDFGTKIRLVNGEEYEEMYTKEPCIDTGELSNHLRSFIITAKMNMD